MTDYLSISMLTFYATAPQWALVLFVSLYFCKCKASLPLCFAMFYRSLKHFEHFSCMAAFL